MPPPCILAVDPGLSGAIAFLWTQDEIAAFDMPVADGNVDVAGLASLIRQHSPALAIVEKVGAMPGQGVSSMFKFGCGFGMVQGVIAALGIPLHLVTPQRWKKSFLLSSDKEASRALALRYWPQNADLFKRKKDEARAEACLIARYAHATGLRGA